MIQATLTGRLGADPEKKTISGGRELVTIRVASNNRKDGTSWVRCTIWRQALQEFVLKNCQSGARVCVAGSLELQTWGEDGENQALELDCSHLELYDWPEGGTSSPGVSKPTSQPKAKPATPAEDLPF